MTSTMHMDRADKNKVGTVEIEDLQVIPVIFCPESWVQTLWIRKENPSGDMMTL